MKERTLLIIKPDAFSRSVAGLIFHAFEENNLKLVAGRFMQLSKNDTERFYAEHKGKEFYEPLVYFMSSNPCFVSVWEGEDAIARSRKIIGSTDPATAQEGTIRKNFATDNRHNAIHGSDSVASAKREIAFFFKKNGILSWEKKEYKK